MANAETIAQNKAKALELLKTGLSVRATAKAVGVTAQAICLWTIKDPEFNEAWEASVVANHMAVVASHNENVAEFREEVRVSRQQGKTEDAGLLAIEEKLVSRSIISSLGVLSKLAKSFAEKLETKNQTEVTGALSVADVATMGDGALHDVIRHTTQQG
jgi:hypothetical protein